MYVDIMFFKEIFCYLILAADRTDVADTGLRRLLHHISKLSGQHDISASRHHIDLDLQGIAAHTGPCKSSYDADFIRRIDHLVRIFFFPQILVNILFCNGDSFFLCCQNLFCRFSAHISDLTLQLSDTGFFRVVACHLPDRMFAEGQLLRLQAVLVKLLRDQVLHCDVQLFILCITADLNDLHTVQKRSRNRLERVCSCNKQYL